MITDLLGAKVVQPVEGVIRLIDKDCNNKLQIYVQHTRGGLSCLTAYNVDSLEFLIKPETAPHVCPPPIREIEENGCNQ